MTMLKEVGQKDKSFAFGFGLPLFSPFIGPGGLNLATSAEAASAFSL